MNTENATQNEESELRTEKDGREKFCSCSETYWLVSAAYSSLKNSILPILKMFSIWTNFNRFLEYLFSQRLVNICKSIFRFVILIFHFESYMHSSPMHNL